MRSPELGAFMTSRVGKIIAWFHNSRLVAPLIAVGVIVIALATFTDSISRLADNVSRFFTPVLTPGGHGPRFENPRLSGRTIDGCILTMKSQVTYDPDACNAPAQMGIASQFCKAANYSRAINFKAEFLGSFQKSYKLSRVLTPSGEVKQV